MTPNLDPSLVAGFAAEARSHLPEIRSALERSALDADSEALGRVRRHISSMRDASSMVGLEPLGRALEKFAQKLETQKPGNSFGVPLQLLDEYLEGLEGSQDGNVEPLHLLSELDGAEEILHGEVEEASGHGEPVPAELLSEESPEAESSAADSAGMESSPGLKSTAMESPSRSEKPLPLPSWMANRAPVSVSAEGDEMSASPPEPVSPKIEAPKGKSRKAKSDGPSAAIREIFAAEADEHAQNISKLLAELKPEHFSSDVVSSLRRRVHNLKGSAALVKLDDLSQVAHGMEDLLDSFYDERRGPSLDELSALELAGDALQALIYDRAENLDVAAVLRILDDAESAGMEADLGEEPERQEGPREATPPESGVGDGKIEEEPPPSEPLVLEPAEAEPQEVEGKVAPSPSLGARMEAAEAEPAQQRQRFVRVSVDALDEAMRLLVEVDAERHLLRDLIGAQKDHALELDLADRRLHREVRALESDLEVAALGAGVVRGPSPGAETPFDALELDQYSELHERSRALIESASDLGTVQADLGGQLVSMDHSIERLEGTTVRLRDRLLGLRLVPFSSLTPRLEGVVRLAARTTGKEARLKVEDGGVELDRDVLDALMDPLDHLLRNAVAHGIETPERRGEAGKEARGTVRLTARYSLGGVEILLSDDGRGIDTESLSRRALERGLHDAPALDALTEDQLRELIFEPGLSTASQVDRLAGRGIGMDVVRQSLGELRGQVSIGSSSTAGTTFRLELPTTLAVQRVLLVTDRGHRLALPSQGLESLERLSADRIERLGEREILRAGTEVFRVVRLAEAAGLPIDGSAPESNGVAILSRLSGKPTAFLVDRILGGREVVVQDLGRHLGRRPGLIGVTQVGTGHPVPILDPVVWLDSGVAVSRPKPKLPSPAPAAGGRRRAVLVVDDSLSMRRYLSQLVERFGYLGIEARDGLEAMELLDGGTVEPDLILLDLEMPRMDGFELMATLKADSRFAGVPRAVLTSRDATKHRRRAAEAGAHAYLVKPVAELDLQITLNRLAREGASP